MYYKVFLDTNIYESAAFNFNTVSFAQIKKLVKEGVLNLQINSVVEGEVKAHITEKIKEAANMLRKHAKERVLSGFRDNEKFNCLNVPDADEWVADALKRFEEFMVETKCERLSISNIDVDELVSDYFNVRPPFEEKKPEEFKDAIIIQSFIKYIENADFAGFNDDIIYVFISKDKGIRRAVFDYVDNRFDEEVIVHDDMNSFIRFFNVNDNLIQLIEDLLALGYGKSDIEESAKAVAEIAYIELADYEGIVDDIENTEISVLESRCYVINAQKANDGCVYSKISIDFDIEMNLSISVLDEDLSPWDNEDKKYIWKTIDTYEEKYKTTANIVLDVDLTKVIVRDKRVVDNWSPVEGFLVRSDDNTQIEFIEGLPKMRVMRMPEFTENIVLCEKDCFYRELIESRHRVD